MLYALAPTFAAMGSKLLFVLGFGIILSMYGGGFATVPAYLADMFGTQFVGDLRELIGLQADQRHPRPAGGCLAGELGPDAAGGSGDENGLTGQGRTGTARHRGSSGLRLLPGLRLELSTAQRPL